MGGYVNTTGKVFGVAVLLDIIFNGGREVGAMGRFMLWGSVAAAGTSYWVNSSLLWAAAHFCLSWYYVAWRAVVYFAGWNI